MAVHVGGQEVVYYTYHSLFHQKHPDSPGSNHTIGLPVYMAHFYSVCSQGDNLFYLREQKLDLVNFKLVQGKYISGILISANISKLIRWI